MMRILVVLFGCSLADGVFSNCTSSPYCPIKLTLRGVRNDTGHNHIQVDMETLSPSGQRPVIPTVKTEHCSEEFDDYILITTKVDVTVPKLVHKRPDYEYLLGLGYYKLFKDPKTWHEAFRDCEKDGAHLIIINTAKEAGVVRQLKLQQPENPAITYPDFFHGGHQDFANEGVFYSVKDEPLDKMYNSWYSGEPNNVGNAVEEEEDCGAIHASGLLADTPCTATLPYICEQDGFV